MKIVVLDGQGLNPGDLDWGCLNQFGEVSVYERTRSEAETIERIGDAELVLTNKCPISETVLDACPSIKLIAVLATGYDVVNYTAAKKRGIPVCNVPSYGTAAVAQFTIALLLELCHQIGVHNSSVHQGDWCSSPTFCYWLTPQMELAGKTLGIVGFGRIGRAVAKLAKGFDMKVLACSRTQYPEGEELAEYVDLDTLLKESDMISLHCPVFPETLKMINADTIARMKDGAMLLNTSRGQLIDEYDLAEALHSGKLRGAALDVMSVEPILADNPLLTAPNCIITPHMAWAPIESRQRLLDCVVENVRGFLSGRLQNVVNP